MKRNITYKVKNKILLAVLICSGLFIYSFTIKKTIRLIAEVNEIENKIVEAKDAPGRSRFLKKEIKKIDLKIGSFDKQNENNQPLLIELVTNYCKENSTILKEFPEVTEEIKGNLLVETNRFVVEGTFSSLLSLVYLLEQKHDLGKVASVDYSLKKDNKTKQMALTAIIYLQNIKKK